MDWQSINQLIINKYTLWITSRRTLTYIAIKILYMVTNINYLLKLVLNIYLVYNIF